MKTIKRKTGPSKNKMYYLASPYTHKNKFVETLRYEAVVYAATKLIHKGYTVVEPIASCHEKGVRYDLPGGYAFWQKRDRWFIDKCDGILVLTLPGWNESVGVSDEIEYAAQLGLEIHYINPEELFEKEVFNALR